MDFDLDWVWGEGEGHGDGSAFHDEPLFGFAEPDVCVGEVGVGEVGRGAAQGDELAVPVENFGVRGLSALVPVEFGALESCGRLRIGDLGWIPSEGGEF